ncbi:MAG: archaellin/type IV pilin N-terminal domain-containing protein [Candidatus Methanospirareceae archaeon]
MRVKRRRRESLRRDKRGFTGLEAAIVLTAFIVVAAVFSYMVLNAGFFTTQKSKEVIHTGVEQTTSSAELTGDVTGYGNTTTNKLTGVKFYLELTAGEHPMDLATTTMAYTSENTHVGNVTYTASITETDLKDGASGDGNWSYTILGSDGDSLLEKGEKVEISMVLPENGVEANKRFSIEVKPATGATIAVTRTAPASIDAVMNLH